MVLDFQLFPIVKRINLIKRQTMIMSAKMIFLLFIVPAVSFAQLSGKGKIITVEGDTIECLVQIDKEQFTDVVRYKREKDDYLQLFPLSDLYRIIIKDKVYENLVFTKRTIIGHKVQSTSLCLCVVDGFVKLYREGITMFCQGSNQVANPRTRPSERDIYYLMNGAEEAQQIKPKLFIKQSQEALVQYKEVVQMIEEEKYQYKDLVQIVRSCNESLKN